MSVELKVGIGADISELTSGINQAEREIDNFLTNVNKISKVGEKLQSIGTSLTVGLTLPIVAFGAAAVKSYGDIQALQKGLEAVTGSAESAKEEFTLLKEVAKLPGLGMEEAVKGSINLQAIGLSAEKSRSILSQFGNAVATVGKGRVEFERAIYGVQQLANTDFPLGEDLNIIKDALPQVSSLLKDAFGTSRSDELTKMGKSSEEVLNVILTGLGKLPRVTGGINGAFENMSDSIKTSMGRIGKIIDENFDISGIVDKLVGYIDSAVSAFENLSPEIQNAILVTVGLVAAIGPLLVVIGSILAVLPSVVAGFGFVSVALTALTAPIGLVIIGLVAIVAAVVDNWDKIKPYIINTINYFRELYNESFVLRAGINLLVAAFKNSFATIAGVLGTAYELFKTFAKSVVDIFSGIGTIIEGALTFNDDKIYAGISQIKDGYLGAFTSAANDLKVGATKLFNSVNSNVSQAIKDTLSKDKLAPITDIKIFDEKKVEENTSKSVVDAIKNGVKSANAAIGADNSIAIDLTPIKTDSVGFELLGEYFDNIYDYESKIGEVATNIKASLAKIPAAMSETNISLRENLIGLKEAFTEMSDFGNFIGDTIAMSFNSVVDTISDTFSSIGEAMAAGGDIFSAAGNAILSGVGSFLGELGKQMIQYGVAALAMSVLSKIIASTGGIAAGPAAVAMIAAGAALSLASGAIKSVASGGSSSSSTPTSAGSSSASYSTSYSGTGGNAIELFARISGQDLLLVTERARDKNTRLGG